LASIDTDPHLLPSTRELTDKMWKLDPANSENPAYDLAVMKRWLAAIGFTANLGEDLSQAVAPLLPTNDTTASSPRDSQSSADILELSFLKRSHLFLCSDMAKRLLYSSCPSLREEATNILK
jgi:hypothetical protein